MKVKFSFLIGIFFIGFMLFALTGAANAAKYYAAAWGNNPDMGMSGYIFSFDSGNGTRVNDSWQPMTGTGNWSNFTKTLNSTYGVSVGYRFYVNDSANTWADTGVQTPVTIGSYPEGNATVTCTDKIYISNGWANLYTIYKRTNWNTSCIQEVSSKVWLLRKPIQVQSTGTLYINNSDTNWLKLLSLNDSNVAYIYNYRGYLEINNTKITSWNTNNNSVAPSTDATRSYIYSESRTNIYNSNISYLGTGVDFQSYGVHWAFTSDSEIINNTFTGSFADISAYISNNITVRGNYFADASRYLVWFSMTPAYGNITVDNNTFYLTNFSQNGVNGLEMDSGYGYNVSNNKFNGTDLRLVLDGHDSIISGNDISGVWAHGPLEVHGTDIAGLPYTPWNVIVENNIVHDTICLPPDSLGNCHGIYIHNVGVHNVTVRNNLVYNVTGVPFYFYEGYDLSVYNNTGWGSQTNQGMVLTDIVNSSIYNNNVTGSSFDIYVSKDTCSHSADTGCWTNKTDNLTFSNNALTVGKITIMPLAVLPETNGIVTFVDTKSPNNTYTITSGALDANHSLTYVIEYSDSKVLSSTVGSPRWYPDKSNLTLVNNTNSNLITYYNLTARPSTSYLNITVNKINEIQDVWNITVSSSVAENPTTFTLQTTNPNTNYVITRDGVNYSMSKTDSSGLLNYTYSDTGTDWATSHRFEFVQGITPTGTIIGTVSNGTSPIQGATIQAGSYSNTTNSTGQYLMILPSGNYTVTASAGGYQSQAKNATVLENQTTVVNFNLTAAITTTTSTTTTSTTTTSTTTLTTSTTTTSSTTSTSTTTMSSTTSTTSTTTASTTSTSATTSTTAASTSTTTSVTSTSVTSSTSTLPLCQVKGDLPPCDGFVDDWELLDYINKWAKGLVPDFDLLEAIKNWAGG